MFIRFKDLLTPLTIVNFQIRPDAPYGTTYQMWTYVYLFGIRIIKIHRNNR